MEQTAEAVWDSDTLALLRSECNGIESEQGSGSKGDAVLYNKSQGYVNFDEIKKPSNFFWKRIECRTHFNQCFAIQCMAALWEIAINTSIWDH